MIPFLAPWMLYGLAALSVPIVIHLWQRRRVVQIPFSTLRFLKIVAARTSRTSKIENFLLLLLRCALFILLVLAAARPVMLAKSARIFGGEVPRTVILVIDNSMSMGLRTGDRTRLDAAKQHALAVFEDLKQGDRVAVITANTHGELLVAEPTIDRAVARKAVEGVHLTQLRSDFSAALREARNIAAHTDRGIREIFLFTDNQESGWRSVISNPTSVFDAAWKQSEPRLIVVRPDDQAALNATVKQVSIKTPFLAPGATVRGVATLENISSAPLHDLLTVEIGGERVAQRPADLPPGGFADLEFEFPAPPAAGRWAKGVAHISTDYLPADDRFSFTVPVFQQPRILIVEGQAIGPERLRSGFYLRKALAARPENSSSATGTPTRTISTQQLDDTALDETSAVFLADCGKLSDRSIVRLDRFLDAGGMVVLFPGDLTGLSGFSNLDFLPGKPASIRTLEAGRQPVKIVQPSHPLFTNAWDGDTPFPALPQQRMLDWAAGPESKTLVTLTGGSNTLPFVITSERGAGCVLFVNASADRTWGDFPLSPAFLPLVQQIARLSASQLGRQLSFIVGDSLPLPPNLPKNQPVRITLPDGTIHNLPATRRDSFLERAEQAGIYEISAGNETAVLTVNTDPEESDLRPIALATLEKLVSHDELVGLEALKQWLAQTRGLVPLWPLLLGLALLVFCAEAVLSNVMAGRRAQGDEPHIKTGRLNRPRAGVHFRAPGVAEEETAPL